MAERCRTLPLSAPCLSPLPRFEYQPGHLRKLPVTWGWAVFAGCTGFSYHLQLANALQALMG